MCLYYRIFGSWWLLYTAMAPGSKPSDSAVVLLLKSSEGDFLVSPTQPLLSLEESRTHLSFFFLVVGCPEGLMSPSGHAQPLDLSIPLCLVVCLPFSFWILTLFLYLFSSRCQHSFSLLCLVPTTAFPLFSLYSFSFWGMLRCFRCNYQQIYGWVWYEACLTVPSRHFLLLPFLCLFLWFSKIVLEERGSIIIKACVALDCFVSQPWDGLVSITAAKHIW